MPAPRPSSAAIQRAVSAVSAQGLRIGAVVVGADGSIRIEMAAPAPESLAPPAPSAQLLQPKKWATRG